MFHFIFLFSTFLSLLLLSFYLPLLFFSHSSDIPFATFSSLCMSDFVSSGFLTLLYSFSYPSLYILSSLISLLSFLVTQSLFFSIFLTCFLLLDVSSSYLSVSLILIFSLSFLPSLVTLILLSSMSFILLPFPNYLLLVLYSCLFISSFFSSSSSRSSSLLHALKVSRGCQLFGTLNPLCRQPSQCDICKPLRVPSLTGLRK